jgi:hypothetical protein
MKIIEINEWYGRFGNNILQLIYAIIIALDQHYNKVIFKKHPYFINTREIIVSAEEYMEDVKIRETFFPFNYENKPKLQFSRMKYIFKKYIENILIFKHRELGLTSDDIVLHVRSGDIFQTDAFAYVQPPVYFYKSILKNYSKKRILVSEDCLNPCINWLIQNEKCQRFTNNTLIDDINILINAPNVCFGYGTFGIFMLLMNDKLKNLYLPDYVYDKMTSSWNIEFDLDFKIHIIELPRYIPIGKWFRTKENLKTMIDYTPPTTSNNTKTINTNI